ncbi:MAG: 3-phosphoshikimate 1-carboxyvinyltransferase [Oscillospiraceae bacterium]
MRAIFGTSVLSGTVKVPPSKSMAHRAILAAGLARGFTRIYNLAYSKDIAVTIGGIRQLGAKVTPSTGKAEIEGRGGFGTIMHPIQCGESGSTLRFLIPLASLTGQQVTFVGAERLFERPQQIYADIFKSQGLTFRQTQKSITLQGALAPGSYTIPGNVSSQFISGLLFAMPLMHGDSVINIIPPFESKSYVKLTLAALRDFNVKAEFTDENTIEVSGNQPYYPCEYTVEGDFSQSAFFAVLGAVKGDISVTGLRCNSLQGDRAIMDILKRCGAKYDEIDGGYFFHKSTLKASEIDLADCPDLGPILMTLGALCKGKTVIHNAERLRIKESDRIAAMEQELAKLGCEVSSCEGTVTITGAKLHGADDLFSHNDHRIAMALAVAVLASGVAAEINGAEAVAKSYPDFYDDLLSLGAKVDIPDD